MEENLMMKALTRAMLVIIGLTSLAAGYAWIGGRWNTTNIAAARSPNMPDVPRILFLAPNETTRGSVSSQTVQAHGATLVESWAAARQEAGRSPLDALLIDASLLESASQADIVWLREQFRDGVVIVGIGVKDDLFAQELGVKTLRYPNEDPIEVSPTQYILVYALLLGRPGDVQTLEDADWISLAMKGELSTVDTIQGPTTTMFGRAIDQIDTDKELGLMFTRVNVTIQGIYEGRAEFQSRLEKWTHGS
jgi:hypothetical protein